MSLQKCFKAILRSLLQALLVLNLHGYFLHSLSQAFGFRLQRKTLMAVLTSAMAAVAAHHPQEGIATHTA